MESVVMVGRGSWVRICDIQGVLSFAMCFWFFAPSKEKLKYSLGTLRDPKDLKPSFGPQWFLEILKGYRETSKFPGWSKWILRELKRSRGYSRDLRGSERVSGFPQGFLGVLKGSWVSSRDPGGPQENLGDLMGSWEINNFLGDFRWS